MKLVNLISLLVVIIIFIYFLHQKAKRDYFSIPIIKPEKIVIKTGDNLLWINKNLKNIQVDTSNFSTKFLPTNFVSYTNRSIDNNNDYYRGFYFQVDSSLNDFKIGFHHGALKDFQKPLDNLDFAFHFVGGNKIKIEEKFNPYLETQVAKGSHQYVDINYCHSRPKRGCQKTSTSLNIEGISAFAILIFDNLINYVLVQLEEVPIEGQGDKVKLVPSSSILIHQSINKVEYPLYPAILNQKNENSIVNFHWSISSIIPAPAIYSAELLNPVKYGLQPLPPQESLERYAPEPSITNLSPPPAEPPAPPIYPWDRKLEILNARLDKDSKILSLFVKTINMTQSYLKKLYGVSIILSINSQSQKNKKLNIPYIPLIKENDLELDGNNVVKMSVSLADHLAYFYQKDLQVKVVFRLGEFTTTDNIHSPEYLLD